PAFDTATSDVPSPFTSGAAKASQPIGGKEPSNWTGAVSTSPSPVRAAATKRWPSPTFAHVSLSRVKTYAVPGAPETVIGMDITRHTWKSRPRFSTEGVGDVSGTGCHAKLDPWATGNRSVAPAGRTYTTEEGSNTNDRG